MTCDQPVGQQDGGQQQARQQPPSESLQLLLLDAIIERVLWSLAGHIKESFMNMNRTCTS